VALETLYEESAINLDEKKQKTYYTIFHVVQIVSIVLAIAWFVFFGSFLPVPDVSKGETFASVLGDWIFFFIFFISFILGAVFGSLIKKRFNVSYDYVCVSGELRISKVLNQRKRRLVARIDPSDILQVGDMDSPSYDRLRATPGTKEIVCTPNMVAGSGKFFLYVLAVYEGEKKLFLLECREALLLNIMQFLRRDVLDRDYVPQAKKL
jgi:hypothetical protein